MTTLPSLRCLVCACLASAVVGVAHGQAHASPSAGHALAADGERSASAEWHALTSAQKKVLGPLAPHWHTLDGTSREKWLNIANRFDRLSPT